VEWTPTPDEPSGPEVAFTRAAFAGATTIFLVCGTTASLYGPLLVTFAHHFRVSLPAAGAVVSVHFVGALCGVPAAWAALQRYPGRAVLAGALATMALGAAGAALARGFDELLASVVVIGLGFGGMDFSLNSLLVRAPEVGRAHRLSVANAGYGIGSIVGPLLVIVARPANYPLLFVAVGAVALLLTASTGGVGAPRMARAHPSAPHPQRRAALGVFVAAYILYVATESSAAAWIAPQLHRVGYSQSTGAVATAGFWLGLTVGRFLAGPAHRRVSDRRLVLVGLAVTVALALAASVDAVAPGAYPLAGLSLALVYPMGLIWFTNINPGDGDGLVILILTMMAGGVIGPALTGVAVSVAGVRAVPVCIAVFAAADLAVFLVARQFRAPPGSEPGSADPSD
jgi:FHS family glucose/mannose:H+ symporter-like MFS transporter